MPTEYRPEEVRVWMKKHRSFEKLPTHIKSSQFAVAWKQWWMYLQPPCRMLADGSWPPPQNVPEDPSEWDRVARGGNNGFFLVILTLAWWLYAVAQEGSDMEDLEHAVKDVSWVLQQVTAYLRAKSTPGGSDCDDERPNKRARLA